MRIYKRNRPFKKQKQEARLAVERQWRAAFPGGETLIDAVGFDFDVEAVDSGDEGICAWVGPHRYGNPVAAFDGGAALSVNDIIADNFAHASFSKISFFHDIFLLITQLRLPSGQ